MKEATQEDRDKAWNFLVGMIGRGDVKIPLPPWCGIAIIDAFLAGIEAARQEMTEKEQLK